MKEIKEKKLLVNLENNSYPIFLGIGIFKESKKYIENVSKGKKIIIVTDSNLKNLYGQEINEAMSESDLEFDIIQIKPGEESKSLNFASKLYNQLGQLNVERQDRLIAFGGGVVGDLAGFVAATYLRGIPFIQIPTTLLSQIDSSIGGKVGVDLPWGKNMVGAFYQPKLVIIDLDFLKTLPDEEFKNGLAEIIKTALLSGGKLYKKIFEEADRVKKVDVEVLVEIVEMCCQYKTRIVETDEKDTGIRAVLNLGHTLGHALEAAGDFKEIKHGQGVAVGLLFSLYVSQRMGKIDYNLYTMLSSLVKDYDILPSLKDYNQERIKEYILYDKKRKKNNIEMVLLEDIGQPELESISIKEIKNFLEKFFLEVIK